MVGIDILKRMFVFLTEFVGDIFKFVAQGSTPEQWANRLRVPLEHAAAAGNLDLFDDMC